MEGNKGGKKLNRCIAAFLITMLALVCGFAPVSAAQASNKNPGQKGKTVFACDISAANALKLDVNNKSAQFVDVRDQDAYSRFRIPGSINMPLDFIRTKTFLKGKTLVLVDEGYRRLRLEKTCADLHSRGFNPSILAGGLSAWQAAGGAMEGDSFAAAEIRSVDVLTFQEENGAQTWLVIDVSARHVCKDLIPRAVHLPLANQADKAVAQLRGAVPEGWSPAGVVMVCDEKGERFDRIDALARLAGISNLVYLRDGREGYDAFLRNRTRMQAPSGERVRVSGGCKTCPE